MCAHISDDSLLTRRIFLWCAPRCLSTVFERSVRQLTNVKVLYEPMQQAYYQGPEQKRNPYPNLSKPEATFEAARKCICAPYDGFDAVFVKEMAYYIEGCYKEYIAGPFANFKHTFLIRHPLKAITSLYKGCKLTEVTDEFHSMAGFHQMYELFQVVQQMEPNPIVIDADDLLDNPEGMMKQYCSATGLIFSEHMLSWSPDDVVTDWTSCPDYKVWHGSVMSSSGFMKRQSMPSPNLSEYPIQVAELVEELLPLYRAMYDARLKPVKDNS